MQSEQMSRIKNQAAIRAPRSKVWKALTTPQDFATWFHVKTETKEFRAGEAVQLVSTYPGHEGTAFSFEVVEIAPEHRFVWRWRPSADEAYTTVTFDLEETPDGTLVNVTESGFDNVSLERRAKAFESNTKGWEIQMKNLYDYVEQKQ